MKFRTTLILFILVFVLGIFYVIFTAPQPKRKYLREARERIFAPADLQEYASPNPPPLVASLTSVELRNGDALTVANRATDRIGEWWIAKPFATRADIGLIATLIEAVEEMRYVRTLQSEADKPLALKEYGLSPAARSITLRQGQRSWTLEIGDKTPDGQSVYAAQAGDKAPLIYVVPLESVNKVLLGAMDLRDKSALRFNKDIVTHVQIRNADSEIELEKQAGAWRLTKPVQDDANPTAVAQLLGATAEIQVEPADFIAEEDSRAAEFGLDKPALTFAVQEGNTRRELLLGAIVSDKPGKLYARRADEATLFALSTKSADALRRSAADLRSRVVAPFKPEEVMQISIASPAGVIRLARNGDAWKMEEPAGLAADANQVKLFLNDLYTLEAKEWFDGADEARLAEMGLVPPQMQVTLKLAAGDCTLRFGKATDRPNLIYARRGDQGPVLAVSSFFADRLSAGSLAFASRAVMEFRKEQATGIRIERPGEVVALEKQGEKWVFADSKTEAEFARVDDLLWAISYVEAKRLVAPAVASDLARYGLEQPPVTVAVTLAGDAQPKLLRIGSTTDAGTYYAMIEGGDRIFTLPKSLVDQLMADFTKKTEN